MKKLITLIVALMAIATSAYSFVLEVDGYSVTADNGYIIPSSDIHFDVATMTLTIENLQSSRSGACIYAADFGTDELKIVVNGSCSLVSYSEEALYIENSNVTVTGSGKLSLESKEKAAIVVGSNSKLVFSDADVVASGCGVIKGASGAENNSVVIDRSKFVGSNDGSGNASVEGLADFTLSYAEFDDVTFQYEEEYNAPCTFYGTSFYFDKTAGSLCYNGQYLNEDYETTAPYNDVWYYGFSIAPIGRIGIWIDNEAVTQTHLSGSGWSYNETENTLYLTGDIMTYSSTGIYVDGNDNPTLNICVQNESTLVGAFEYGLLFGGNGSHRIYGDGTLNIKSRVMDPMGAIACGGACNLTFKDLTINIEQTGGVGINCNPANSITLDSCAMSVKTANGTAWFRHATCTPELIDCVPTSPAGSRIHKNGWYYDREDEDGSSSFVQVVDGVIERVVNYQLWYQGEQVNNFNYSDWYNPEENLFNVYYTVGSEETIIVNNIKDLTVSARKEGATDWYWTSSKAVLLTHADMTLTQQESVQLPMTSKEESVLCVDNDATLTITNADLYLYSLNKWAITGNGQNEKLVLRNVVITAYGEEGAIGGFSEIVMEQCHIVYPEGGYIKDGCVVDKTGQVAKTVVINSVYHNDSYDISVNNTKVYNSNKNDILGDGMFSFDPSTLTLFIKGGNPEGICAITNRLPGVVIRVLEDSELNGGISTIRVDAPTTITGKGKLTLKGNMGIDIYRNAILKLEDANIEIEPHYAVYTNKLTEVGQTRLFIKNSNVSSAGIIQVGGSISLEDCEIVEPEGAYVENGTNYATILNENGDAQAQNIVIRATKPQTPTAVIQPSFAFNHHPTPVNLAGQRVGKDYKGIVILNGRKVVVQ